MNKIYIVMGHTGEYSDSREWPVIAYHDKSRAEKHADAAMIEADRIQKALDNLEAAATGPDFDYEALEEAEKALKNSNVMDPNMHMDMDTGTDYFVTEVELAD